MSPALSKRFPFLPFRWEYERFAGQGGLGLCAGLVALLGCVLFLATDAGRLWEAQTVDIRFRARGARPSAARIVLIVVDEATEARWREPSIFWNPRYARVLAAARAHDATCVALDSISTVDADAYLDGLGVADALRPDTPLARLLLDAAPEHPFVLAWGVNLGGQPLVPIPRFQSLPAVADSAGFIDLLPDADGVLRVTPLWVADAQDQRENRARAAFAARIALRGTAPTLARLRRLVPPAAILPEADSQSPWARFWINYTGRPFPTLSAWRVETDALNPSERVLLRDARVLVGVTAPRSGDVVRTPYGIVSGVAVHAHAVATLLDNAALRPWPEPFLALWLCVLAGMLPLALALRLASRIYLLCLVTLVGGVAAAAQMAFHENIILPIGGLLLCVGVPAVTQQIASAAEERIRRQQMRRLLGRSVSPQVRDYLLENPHHLSLTEGMECEATILFFDIRGSLTFAEPRTPMETLAELNEFFAPVVPCLETHGGLLFRYTGDGFLAVFGAPRPVPDSAARAVAASVALVEAVATINQERIAQNRPPRAVGCGLHTGPIVCGHLGIAERSDFTVIGDVVNRAARLESANKPLHANIVISVVTWEAVSADTRPAGFVGPIPIVIAGSKRHEEVYYQPADVG